MIAFPHDPPEPDWNMPATNGPFRIPAPIGEPLWWDDPAQADILDHFILSRRALGHTYEGGLMIVGEPGSGKTQSGFEAVKRVNAEHGLSLRVTKMDCATVTDPQKWFGRREVDANGTRYHSSDFVIAVERGDVILLDDVSRLHPHLHNPVMAFLDGSNAVALSDLNLTINRHPDTVFLATANLVGGGTYRMDPAMRERFPVTIERPWPPADIERRILSTRTSVDDKAAANLVRIATAARVMRERGDLRASISTRTLIAASWWVAAGMSETAALEITAIPLFDGDATGLTGGDTDRTRIRALIAGKG